MPLAIELAAARVGVLTVEAIAARLDDRFRLLSAGNRAVVPRQQTLRSTMDWSYNLLSDAEQVLLCRLAVFAAGWTLAAAEAIAADERVDVTDVLDLLGALVAKSLVQATEQDGETRYGLLETVREYARDRLRALGEESIVRARHAGWYCDLAQTAAQHLRAADQMAWLERLEAEHDNLRAALTWALESRATEQGLRLAASLARFWGTRGHLSEGRRWLARLLAVGADVPPLVRAAAARESALLATYQGDHAQAATLLAESLTVCRALADTPGVIATLERLADLTYREGDYVRAEALFEESLALARQEHDRAAIAYALNGLGNVANERGEYALAAARYQESLGLRRAMGDVRSITITLNNMGNLAYAQHDFDRAAALHEENIAVRRALGDRLALATALGNLAKARKAQGDLARARAHLEEALILAREVASRRTIADTLTYLADLRLEQGDLRGAADSAAEALVTYREVGDKRGIASALDAVASVVIVSCQQTGAPECDDVLWAVRLLAAGEVLRASIGLVVMPADRLVRDKRLAMARTLLGDHAYDAAWAEGQAMSLEEGLAHAQSHYKAYARESGAR
jgi:tetratricopeptide (TPR) repeat protein